VRKAIIASMLLVAPLYAQNTVGGPPLLSCGPPESFISSSMNRELIIRARATSVSDRVVSSLDYTANMEVLEVLKGQFAAPAISVLIEDRRLAFRAGDEWLLALPGAGTRFIPRCGIFAVRIDSGNAIGRVESVDSEQSVPLERIRGVYRAPAR
jgi:hypothetical protein